MKIDSHTKIFGLMGYPVRHSLSPFMHNAAFAKLGLNAAYLLFEVKPENLKEAISGIKALGIGGLNVTIPYKESVCFFLDEIDPEARLIGAVNTILLKDNRLIGYNTDGGGFIKSLIQDARLRPKKKNFFVLGAGGAARAIGFNLAREGAKTIIFFDIVKTKAQGLAIELRNSFPHCRIKIAPRLDKSVFKEIDVLINATPMGMKATDPLIVDPQSLHPNLIVCDLIYNPAQTKLLALAKKKKLKAINGLGMLLYQGAISFEIWTAKKAPINVMRKALQKAISATA